MRKSGHYHDLPIDGDTALLESHETVDLGPKFASGCLPDFFVDLFAELSRVTAESTVNAGTRGFAAPEGSTVAVCVLPGTELAFSSQIAVLKAGFLGWKSEKLGHTTAINAAFASKRNGPVRY
jgi:hypothetical protein